jgi:5-carboxymethyl-2-hydroxymuconate isomerase
MEYSSNIAGDLEPSELLRTLHDNVVAHDIAAVKIKSRAVALTDFIIGDEQTHTSMVHVSCALLAGRPDPFSQKLAQDLLKTLQLYLDQRGIHKCSASIEVREMNPDTYAK